MNYKNLCIIQARTGSTRLPEKVLLKVNGIPLLEYEIERVKQAKQLDKIVVATT
ncbi:acylneuraminate cytidylyltransferase, partial [Candidatus Falkowbacteria bacterium CG10_big_fil_rev_8_21_14_0_10_43_11]